MVAVMGYESELASVAEMDSRNRESECCYKLLLGPGDNFLHVGSVHVTIKMMRIATGRGCI